MKSILLLLLLANFAHAAGGPGNALSFDGVDDYVSVPYTAALRAYPLTATAWIKTSQASGNAVLLSMLNGGGMGGLRGWQVYLVNGSVAARYINGTANFVPAANGGPVADGGWHHIAFVVDAAGGRIYVDGALQQSRSWSGTAGAALSTSDVLLGRRSETGSPDYFSGLLDEVTVWNAALSQAQIQAYKNRSLTGAEPGLIAYYRCDEAGGATVSDSAPASLYNHGTLLAGTALVPSTVAPFSPGAETLPASFPGNFTAVLNGWSHPAGTNTSAWFQWGLTTNYGSVTSPQTLGDGSDPVSISLVLNSLAADVTYHFRAVASNSLGVAFGTNQSFSFNSFAPAVTNLAGLFRSTLAWGDYDNNGRLDLLLSSGEVLRNNGSGFSLTDGGVPEITGDTRPGAVTWGDADNDEWLDVLLSGTPDATVEGAISQVWQNGGSGSGFTNTGVELPGYVSSAAEWGDYDNDGRQDFLLMGYVERGLSGLWRNTSVLGFLSFTNVTADVPVLADGSADWGDYDNDGRLDLLIAGGGVTCLRRNTGDGFTNIAIGLPQVTDCSVAWGDYDNDGRLDVLIAGIIPFGQRIAQVWRNTGSTFTNVPIPGLRGVSLCSVAWGDYDNDGRLDFLIAGTTNGNYDGPFDGATTEVWRNTGSGFANLGVRLPGVMLGAVAWADYDNDGRLDIALTGGFSGVFRNQMPASNSPPTAPTGLSAIWSNGTLRLSWNAATDSATPAAGLTYNVRAGTTPGGIDLISPQSAANGFRRVPAMGNAQLRRFTLLEGLTNGQKVYWSVQAVDSGFAGGPFAPESSFTVAPPLSIAATGTTVAISWPALSSGWVLQEASNLGATGWSDSPSGAANPVTLSVTNAAKFYRLVLQ